MAMRVLAGGEVAVLKDTGESAMKASLACGMPKGYEAGYQAFSINGRMLGHGEPVRVRQGCRLRMRNASDDIHPIHLHRHSFELTRISGRPTAGVVKDVVMVGGYQEVEVDFIADNPGLTLFHCHQQLHMDYGFMALFDYA